MILAQEPINYSKLEKELKKVLQIDSVGLLSNQFLLGYIASHTSYFSHPQEWRALWNKLQFLKSMVVIHNINVEDVIQIVQFSLLHSLEKKCTFKELSVNQIIEQIGKNYDHRMRNPHHFKEKLEGLSRKPISENKKIPFFESPNNRAHQGLFYSNNPKITHNLQLYSQIEGVKSTAENINNVNYLQHYSVGNQKINSISKQSTYDKTESLYQSHADVMPGQIYNSKRETFKQIPKIFEKKNKPSFLHILSERKTSSNQEQNTMVRQIEKGLKSSTRSLEPARMTKILREDFKQPQRLKPHKMESFQMPEEKRIDKFLEVNKAKRQMNERMIESSLLMKLTPLNTANELEKTEKKVKGENSFKGTKCQICYQQIPLNQICPMSCGDVLHKTCLNSYFKSKVEVKSLPVLCPYEGCMKEISLDNMQDYIYPQLRDKYYQFSLHLHIDKSSSMSWCPTPGCSEIFSKEGRSRQYSCPTCRKSYCSKCGNPVHEGLTCEQSRSFSNLPKEDRKFIDFARDSQYKQCPSCHFWVQKSKGCNHMTCRCKYQFCYQCGTNFLDCQCQQNDGSDFNDYNDFYF